jgi:5,6-dimethylbenzimidazole synthase
MASLRNNLTGTLIELSKQSHDPSPLRTESQEQLWDLFVWRRDVRHFRSCPLPDGSFERLIDAACLAPSVGNSQPWRFLRVLRPETRLKLLEHVDAEVETSGSHYSGPQQEKYRSLQLHGLRHAPEVLAVYCDEATTAGSGLGRQTMPETLRYSVVLSISNLWLMARSMNIGVGWVSILKPDVVNQILKAEDRWTLIALLCIGIPEWETDKPLLETSDWQSRVDRSQLLHLR